jgi:hypothetical protein
VTDRLAPFLDRLDRIGLDDLQVLSLPRPDPDARSAILRRVEDAAAGAGADRVAEISGARAAARVALFRRMGNRALEVTFAGPTWRTVSGRTDDLVRLGIAIEDAAVAEVVADIADPEDVAALREPFEIAASMVGTAPSRSLILDRRRGRLSTHVAVVALVVTGASAAVAAAGGLLGGRRRPPRAD